MKIKQKYPSSMIFSALNFVYQSAVNKTCKIFKKKHIRPYMNEPEIHLIKWLLKELSPDKCLEWGAGHSTLFFPLLLNETAKWYSVEHDFKWSQIVKAENKNKNVIIYNIKPNSFPWSDENKDGTYENLKDYINFPDTLGKFDFILIDGRARVACMEKAHQLLNKNGIVILHDAERKYYHKSFNSYKYKVMFENKDNDRSLWIGSNDFDISSIINNKKCNKLWNINIFIKKA